MTKRRASRRRKPVLNPWLTVIAEAVARLSRHRIEAVIIVAESTSSIPDEGVVIEGRLSAALLVALFLPERINELSSGAVVVRDGVVERAAVPVLRGAGWDWIGSLAQEVSALVIAVSEDDGVVRLGHRHGATAAVPPASLADALSDRLRGTPDGTFEDPR